MTPARTSYDEIDTPSAMRADAAAAWEAVGGPPSRSRDEVPREVVKGEISVDEAAARIANALHLHLD
jgi:hypothetical protein